MYVECGNELKTLACFYGASFPPKNSSDISTKTQYHLKLIQFNKFTKWYTSEVSEHFTSLLKETDIQKGSLSKLHQTPLQILKLPLVLYTQQHCPAISDKSEFLQGDPICETKSIAD